MFAWFFNFCGKKSAQDPHPRCLYCTQVCTPNLKFNFCSPLSLSSFSTYRQVRHKSLLQQSRHQKRRMSDSSESNSHPSYYLLTLDIEWALPMVPATPAHAPYAASTRQALAHTSILSTPACVSSREFVLTAVSTNTLPVLSTITTS